MSTYAILMAGGSGTRFWPASRKDRPKQFLPIASERPLLRDTFARLEGFADAEHVLVVTAAHQADLVREVLPELPAENLLVEPEGRNTAPCIALAAFEVERRDPDAVQVVLAADHVIEPAASFRATLSAAAEHARSTGFLLTLGIRPTWPATGYGYIRAGEQVGSAGDVPVFQVDRFVEKPDRASAEGFVKSGRFYWNSGNFVWSTQAILEAYRTFLPQVHDALKGATGAKDLAAVYADLPAVPVDKAIMERSDNVQMLPIDYRWSDVGSWAALEGVHEADAAGNRAAMVDGALLVTEDAENCIAYAEGDGVVALLGVKDLIVVQAGNATLVCPRDRAEDVKALVERLKKEGPHFL